jgi:hypothetical protein
MTFTHYLSEEGKDGASVNFNAWVNPSNTNDYRFFVGFEVPFSTGSAWNYKASTETNTTPEKVETNPLLARVDHAKWASSDEFIVKVRLAKKEVREAIWAVTTNNVNVASMTGPFSTALTSLFTVTWKFTINDLIIDSVTSANWNAAWVHDAANNEIDLSVVWSKFSVNDTITVTAHLPGQAAKSADIIIANIDNVADTLTNNDATTADFGNAARDYDLSTIFNINWFNVNDLIINSITPSANVTAARVWNVIRITPAAWVTYANGETVAIDASTPDWNAVNVIVTLTLDWVDTQYPGGAATWAGAAPWAWDAGTTSNYTFTVNDVLDTNVAGLAVATTHPGSSWTITNIVQNKAAGTSTVTINYSADPAPPAGPPALQRDNLTITWTQDDAGHPAAAPVTISTDPIT